MTLKDKRILLTAGRPASGARCGVRVSLVEPGSVGSDMQESDDDEQKATIAREKMLRAEDFAEAMEFIPTRPHRADVVSLRIEPCLQALT